MVAGDGEDENHLLFSNVGGDFKGEGGKGTFFWRSPLPRQLSEPTSTTAARSLPGTGKNVLFVAEACKVGSRALGPSVLGPPGEVLERFTCSVAAHSQQYQTSHTQIPQTPRRGSCGGQPGLNFSRLGRLVSCLVPETIGGATIFRIQRKIVHFAATSAVLARNCFPSDFCYDFASPLRLVLPGSA